MSIFVLCGVPFSFYILSSFCVYVGQSIVLPVFLQVVDFPAADFPSTDLHWAELHYLVEFIFEPLG